ncbi:MAG: glycosyltransferase family 2 protein [Aquabacterium sp.]
MRVSVLIPLYNQADFVAAAVASVQAQTHTDWELIVVDDGSTDGGIDRVLVIKDDRIRVIRQDNSGVSAARNRGLLEASTSWVALLDADDTWAPSHLSDLVSLHERYPEAVLLGSAFWYVDKQGRRLRRSARLGASWTVLTDYCRSVQRQGMLFVTSSVMVKREAALGLGGFKRGVVAGEDLLMWASLASIGQVACLDACSTFYLEPPMTALSRGRVIRRPQEPDLVANALSDLERKPDALSGLRAFRAGWYRMRAVLWLELNERRRCVRELWRAVQCDGLAWRDVVCLVALSLPHGWRLSLLALKRRVI